MAHGRPASACSSVANRPGPADQQDTCSPRSRCAASLMEGLDVSQHSLIKRVLVRTPSGLAFLKPTGDVAAPRTLPPMQASPLGGLPPGLVNAFTVMPLPNVGAVDQMGAPTGVAMLSLSSSGISLSASMPDLPPPSSALAVSRRSGSPSRNRLNASLRTADGLPMPVMTGHSEWTLRRHERQMEKLDFSRRHTENWNAVRPWLMEKEAQRRSSSTQLLRKIKAEAVANAKAGQLRKYWQDEFDQPGWIDSVESDPASIEARRSGTGLSAPMSLRVPPPLHVDGGAHNLDWGGCTHDSVTVGWVGPYVGGELSGMRINKYQLQHRAVGGVASAAAVFSIALVTSHEDMTVVATAAAAEAVAWLMWAHGGPSPEQGVDAPRPNTTVQRAALWALQAAGAAAAFANADARRVVRPSPDQLFEKAYGKGIERELRWAASVAAQSGVKAGWTFPSVHKNGRLVESAESRQGGEQRWALAELDGKDRQNQHRVCNLHPSSWVECRARASTANGFGPWGDAMLLQTQPTRPIAPLLTRLEAEAPYSGVAEWYLCASAMGGAAVDAFEFEVTLQSQVFGEDTGDLASVSRAVNAAAIDRQVNADRQAAGGDRQFETEEAEAPPVAIEWTIGLSAAKPVRLKMRPQLVEFARRWVETAVDCGKRLVGRVDIGDLLPFEQYAIRVRALNLVGSSDWSEWERFKTLPSTETPGPPTYLSEEVARTDSSLTVRWRAPSPPPGAKTLRTCLRHRKKGESGAEAEWTEEAPLAAEGRSRRALEEAGTRGLGVLDVDAWTLSSLQPGTEYEVGVRLENANGPGPWGTILATTLEEGDTEARQPSALSQLGGGP